MPVSIYPNILKDGVLLKILSDSLKIDELIKLQSTDFGDGVFQDHYMRKTEN